MTRWVIGLVVGCLVGAAFAFAVHYGHWTGCSTRPERLRGTVTTCGQRGNLAAVLLPSLFIGAGLGVGTALLSARRED